MKIEGCPFEGKKGPVPVVRDQGERKLNIDVHVWRCPSETCYFVN